MATSTRRSRTSAVIPKKTIEQATQVLQSLPDKSKEMLSLRDAVDVMYDAIVTVLSRGYSHEDVVKMLEQQGLDVSVPTLKYQLNRARKEQATAKPTRGTRKSKAAQAAAEQSAPSNVLQLPTSEAGTTSRKRKTAPPEVKPEPEPKPTRSTSTRQSKTAAKPAASEPTTKAKGSAEPKTAATRAKAPAKPVGRAAKATETKATGNGRRKKQ